MDIIKRGETGVVTARRKKRVKEERKSIFEIYRSPKTIKDYMFYLKDFLNFVYEGEGDIRGDELIDLMKDIDKTDVEDYISHLVDERGLKKTSINKILSALKSLYKEMEKNGFDNPFKYIELFKIGRNIDNILKLSFEDIKKIIGLYKIKGEKEYRNITILYTLFYTGMRSQELLNLKFKHILVREGNYYIKLEQTKSGREQYKSVYGILADKLNEYKNYLQSLYSIDDEEIEEQYVFSSSVKNNTQLSYRALYDLVQNFGKLIGKDISPHNIRHAVATELSINGADLLEIRDFLGHADTRVTEVYINAKSVLEKKVLEKLPSLSSFDDVAGK
ncbi:tyrosine-type recombinase/integrase [Fusobacterium sp.]|uniref:tyrosine-type recombinase/integrase n=1 Tax=Fusobacterium sp. TaxID=68766 RepID=UPI002616B1A0|nr:tyrosine-type recombinase/integrase [Fusobacterium sp.]